MWTKLKQNLLSNPYHYLLISLVFLIPLAYYPDLYLRFELPKSVLFQEIVLICLTGFLLKLKSQKNKFKILTKTFLIIFGLILLSQILSLTFSTIPTESLWGSYARRQGFLTFINYLLFVFLIVNFFETKNVKSILKTILISTIPICLIGFFQKWGLNIELIYSSLGHPNFLAQYLIFTIPLSIYFLIEKEKKWKILGAATLILQLTTLLLTGSRAGLIGVSLAIILLFLSASFIFKKRTYKCLILAVILLMILIVSFANFYSNSDFVKNSSFLNRITFNSSENLVSSNQSLTIRKILWKESLNLIKEKPILGHGQETTMYHITKHMPAELLYLEEYKAVPDRLHSEPLDLLVTTGILGLGTWFIFWAFIIYTSIKFLLSKKNKDTQKMLVATLFSALTGNLIANLFGFNTTVNYIYLYLFIGLILILSKKINTKSITNCTRRSLLFLVVTSLIFITILNSKSINADINFKKGNVETAYALSSQEIYSGFLATKYINNQQYQNAQLILEKAIQNNAYYSDLYTLKGVALSKSNQSKKANQAFQKATELFPYSPNAWKSWGIALLENQEYQNAIQKFEYLLSFSPKYWELDQNIDEQTIEIQKKHQAFFKHNPEFREIFIYLTEAYQQIGNEDSAAKYLEHFKTKTP